MANDKKKEQKLIAAIIVLSFIVMILGSILIGPKLLSSVFPSNHDASPPPSLEESIDDAEIIFSCYYEENRLSISCRINEIFFKNPEYNFPQVIGEFYPESTHPIKEKNQYGDGTIVFLSNTRVPRHSITLINDKIPGFDNISVNDLKQLIKKRRKY